MTYILDKLMANTFADDQIEVLNSLDSKISLVHDAYLGLAKTKMDMVREHMDLLENLFDEDPYNMSCQGLSECISKACDSFMEKTVKI